MTYSETSFFARPDRQPWNKGKIIGPKPPLQPKHVRAIRTQPRLAGRVRDLALFNVALDSTLRACDVVRLCVADVAPDGHVLERATVRRRKTGRPVRFEITEQTRDAIDALLQKTEMARGTYLFPGRSRHGPFLSRRQYARLVGDWVGRIGLDPKLYGTHSLRRTKATLI